MSYWGVGPSILMYHSIADNSCDPYAVSVADFKEQIIWLAQNGFKIISISSMLKLLRARDHKSLFKKVVITFDDGYKDFILNALPILLDRNAPATVFLITGMFGGKSVWNKSASDLQLMTEDEVRGIKEKGISLGSHTSTHINLSLEDNKVVQQQLKESYDVLTRLGESFYTLSYPWGQWSNKVAEAVKFCGYECALTVGEQTRLTVNNSYCLPRITMSRDMDLNSFQSFLNRSNLEKEIRRTYRVMNETNIAAKIKNSLKGLR